MPNFAGRETRSGFPTFGANGPRPDSATTGRGGLGIDSSGNPQLLDDAGTAQVTAATTGTTVTTLLASSIGNALITAANSYQTKLLAATDIPSSAATSVARFTIPNSNLSFIAKVTALVYIADSADAFESARVVELLIVGTRVAGGSAAIAVSSAVGAQIATVGSGATFTFTAAMSSVSGGGTATQTSDLQLNVTPSAGTPNYAVRLLTTLINAQASGASVAAV